jgi:twitching motility two-component system response regulator PilH
MGSHRILIVEDSPTIRRHIHSLLEARGHRLLCAADGEEALQKAIHGKPDLLVLDVILPKKNGFQVCRQLKTAPATADIRILMLTSKTQDSDRFWGLKQGADAYLTKPFDDRDLIASIDALLSRAAE